jgi:hypothetical protein
MKRGALAIATAAAATGLAIPLAATAHHKPGHTGGDTTARLTIAADPEPVLWGDNATISGRLRGPENAGKAIELQHDPHPFGSDYNPEPLARTTTNAQGFYTFTIAPARNTNYRAITTTDPRQLSDNFKLHVRMRINRSVSDRTPRRGQRVAFVGAVAPAHDGQVIRIQRRGSDGIFRTVARTKLTDAGDKFPTNSFYERKLRIKRDGTFRVQVKGDADHSGNSSDPVRIDAH